MQEQEDPKSESRRDFLVKLFMRGGILVSAVVFLRDIWLYLYPDVGKREFTKFMVAKAKEIPVGKARKVMVGGSPLFVIRLPDGFKVFSGICTHLGCLVKWEENKHRFYCPCHKGVFAANGEVVSGPPPRPLDEYKVTIENNLVFIQVERRKGRWS
jgi:cytochrome b6-f complex iron-sulfur subunit